MPPRSSLRVRGRVRGRGRVRVRVRGSCLREVVDRGLARERAPAHTLRRARDEERLGLGLG